MGEIIPKLDIICYQIKPPVPRIGYTFWSLGSRNLTDPPQHYRLLPMLLVILLQLDRKTLLLKTMHSCIIRPREIELLLNWKLHLYWLVIMKLQYVIHSSKKKYNHQSHPVIKSAYKSLEDMPVAAIVAQCYWVTNQISFLLNLRLIAQDGNHTALYC